MYFVCLVMFVKLEMFVYFGYSCIFSNLFRRCISVYTEGGICRLVFVVLFVIVKY